MWPSCLQYRHVTYWAWVQDHESIVLSSLANEMVAYDSMGHKKQKDDTGMQEQWARRLTELEEVMMITYGDVSPQKLTQTLIQCDWEADKMKNTTT